MAGGGTPAGVSRPCRKAAAQELEQIDGFLSIERFESLTEKGKILSLSFFRDETAVQAWRNTQHHRERAQGKGRGGVLADYRLRIAGVIRDYGMKEREQAPKDSRAACQWVKVEAPSLPLSPRHAVPGTLR